MSETNHERRYISGTVERRVAADGTKSRGIAGYALKFGQMSRDLGGFTEIIAPGALDGVELGDVAALFNHDEDYILARTTSQTLKLTVDTTGLFYEFDSPETTIGNDLLVSIDRKDITGSSFGFRCEQDEWVMEGDTVIRTIKKFSEIRDVSPCVFPAYPDATVARRSLDEHRKKQSPAKVPTPEADKIMVEAYKS